MTAKLANIMNTLLHIQTGVCMELNNVYFISSQIRGPYHKHNRIIPEYKNA